MSTDTTNTEAPKDGEPHGDAEQTEAPTVESLQAQIAELTAESRKWEDRSKSNYEKAKEYDELKKAQMSDDEKAAETLSAAEARAKEAEARAEAAARDVLRFKVAAKFGLSDEDAELILTGADEATMSKQAERVAARNSAPKPNPHQGNRGGKAAPGSTGEQFAEVLEGLF